MCLSCFLAKIVRERVSKDVTFEYILDKTWKCLGKYWKRIKLRERL